MIVIVLSLEQQGRLYFATGFLRDTLHGVCMGTAAKLGVTMTTEKLLSVLISEEERQRGGRRRGREKGTGRCGENTNTFSVPVASHRKHQNLLEGTVYIRC